MGGGRLRLRAAARPARADRGAADARPDAGALRPARDAARRRRASGCRLPRRHPPCGARRGLGRARRAPASPSSPPRSGAPRGDYERAARALARATATARRVPRARRPAGRSSCGRRRRPTPCCRCSPPTPGCGCSSRPASPRTGAASADWDGGFWLPECAYAPGPRARSRRPRRALRSASTRPTCTGSARRSSSSRSLTEAGVVARADRLADRRARLGRQRRLPGRPGATATTTTARSTTCGRGATTAAPTTRTRARALAREHARDFVARCDRAARRHVRGARPPRPALLRARHRAARPLVVRGPDVARGGHRRGRRRPGSS